MRGETPVVAWSNESPSKRLLAITADPTFVKDNPPHPGEILKELFVAPDLADARPVTRVVSGRRIASVQLRGWH